MQGMRKHGKIRDKNGGGMAECPCPKEDKIAEREFYYNQKNKLSGTRIFCKCGNDWFIPD